MTVVQRGAVEQLEADLLACHERHAADERRLLALAAEIAALRSRQIGWSERVTRLERELEVSTADHDAIGGEIRRLAGRHVELDAACRRTAAARTEVLRRRPAEPAEDPVGLLVG